MADNPKIVDAVKSEPVSFAPASISSSIPLDTSGLQAAMQEMLKEAVRNTTDTTAPDKINPSTFMRTLSTEIEELYQRFDDLKKLAVELNGKPLSDPLPPTIAIRDITVNFDIVRDGKPDPCTAVLRTFHIIDDIYPLISAEFGLLIADILERAKQLQDFSQKTAERCDTALKDWSEQNKDRKIVRVDDTPQPAS
jgi:hypothetical protein